MRNMVRSCFEALTTPMHVCAFETNEKKSSWSSLRDLRVLNSLDCTPPSFSTHISAGNDRIDSNVLNAYAALHVGSCASGVMRSKQEIDFAMSAVLRDLVHSALAASAQSQV